MPIPEPPAGSKLWSQVRALAAWPATDEDGLRLLAESWARAAGAFENAGRTPTAGITQAWPDAAGTLLAAKLAAVNAEAGATGAAIRKVAEDVRGMAEIVAGAKRAIVALIARNDPLYVSLQQTPPMQQLKFVLDVATLVTQIVDRAAAQIRPPAVAPAADETSVLGTVGDVAGATSAVLAFGAILFPPLGGAAALAGGLAFVAHGVDMIDKAADPGRDVTGMDYVTLAGDALPLGGAALKGVRGLDVFEAPGKMSGSADVLLQVPPTVDKYGLDSQGLGKDVQDGATVTQTAKNGKEFLDVVRAR